MNKQTIALLMASVSATVMAANPGDPASATASASGEILVPITLSTTVLHFGNIVPGNQRSEFVLDRDDGSLTRTSGDARAIGNAHHVGTVTISGSGQRPVYGTIQVVSILGDCSDPSVHLMDIDPVARVETLTTGSLTGNVGGRISIDAMEEPAALVTCSYTLNAQYL